MRNLLLSVLCGCIGCAVAAASPVTNKDVEKLLEAGMSEQIIVSVISSGEPSFDISPEALLALKQKGATDAVMGAVISAQARQQGPGTTAAAESSQGQSEPATDDSSEDIVLVDGDKRSAMVYSVPESRFATRAMGFGGGATYHVLKGPKSGVRITNKTPVFMVSVPKNSRPDDHVGLTLWATRKNGTRELMSMNVTGGFGSSTTGYPAERMIAVEFVKAKKQGSWSVRYEMRPKAPLAPGEYALMSGVYAYDFGVD